jgi:uncharacterized protein (TIGR02231 family)
MKKLIMCLFLISFLHSYADNEVEDIKSEIKGAKVYFSGAEVTRSFHYNLVTGMNELVFKNLSPLIDRNSITLSMKADVAVIGASFFVDSVREKKMSPEVMQMKDTIEMLNIILNDLNLQEQVNNGDIAILSANKVVMPKDTSMNLDAFKKVIDYHHQRLVRLKNKNVEINKRKIRLNAKINELNDQITIESESQKKTQPSGTIIIRLSSKQDTMINADMTYFTQGASWKPLYEVKAKNLNSSVNIVYQANVTQNTGENWEHVRLLLSSGNPNQSEDKPILYPWYLYYRDPEYFKIAYGEQGQKNNSYSEDAHANSNQNQKDIQSSDNQIIADFDIMLPYNIPSADEVIVEIQSTNLPTSFAYIATPKLNPGTFLIASITNWEKLNLLPGNASVYLDNHYIGQTVVDPRNVTDTLNISFGREKRIDIKREKVKDMNITKYSGSNVEKEYMFDTTIKNKMRENVTVTIEDQVPLKTDESMKITVDELSEGVYNPENGLVTWKVELRTGETKTIQFGYKVKYPKTKTIPGL